MTWYCGQVTTKHLRPWPQADKMRGERAIVEMMRAAGMTAHAPEHVRFDREGKDRVPTRKADILLPGYVIAKIPDHAFDMVARTDGVWKLNPIPEGALRGERKMYDARPVLGALDFIEAARRQVEEAETLQAQWEAREISRADFIAKARQFKPGDILDLLSEAFEGMVMDFERVDEKEQLIVGKVNLMGQPVTIKADPFGVRRRA